MQSVEFENTPQFGTFILIGLPPPCIWMASARLFVPELGLLPSAKAQPPEGLMLPLLLPPKTAVALTELGRTEKKMLEKIAVCGREIVTWTAGIVA